MMVKILMAAGGAVATAFGLFVMILPIPFGLPLVIAGLAMMIMGSRRVAAWVRRRRAQHESLNETLRAVQKKSPDLIRKPLKMTAPEHSPN